MEILYSNIPPLTTGQNKKTIQEAIREQIEQASLVDIAVGYISKESLIELDELVYKNANCRVRLTIGMYVGEGMPEGSYRIALSLDKKWREDKRGEIRMVTGMRYHGKVYLFYRGENVFSSIVGSANLGALSLNANNRRQYELCVMERDCEANKDLSSFIDELNEKSSKPLSELQGRIKLIRERNAALDGVEKVTKLSEIELNYYKGKQSVEYFALDLKVDSEVDIACGKAKYAKSNINVCYAAPRSKRKSRDWYEMQLTVNKATTTLPGYPEKGVPFLIVTDDGYSFIAHTTSDGNKQFSAVGDELIMGRWLKGRLVAAELVHPVNDTQKDTEFKGMITKEILHEYGCEALEFRKLDMKHSLENGSRIDVWLLSFVPSKEKED